MEVISPNFLLKAELILVVNQFSQGLVQSNAEKL